jgi:hypothetical protein
VAEPGRSLVRHHRTPSNPPRHFTSVRDLTTKIRQFVNGWNDRKHPFIWTKTADNVLDKINRNRQHISETRH